MTRSFRTIAKSASEESEHHEKDHSSRSLAGSYVGASASAAAGIGVGANALIGGSSKNFALQPVSAQVGIGLNVAAGVSRLQLSHAG
nr:DUF992 domain-containing protein [Rhizobium sp. FKY42]